MENGRFHNFRGSIFLLAIVTISLLSVLFLSLTENVRVTGYFVSRSRHYYHMGIMKEMFLSSYLKLPENERAKEGEVLFNTGKIRYTYREPTLAIIAETSRYKRVYEEKILLEKSEDTEDSTLESKQLLEENDTEKVGGSRK
ncbi:competence type IV pilus minor pilin ComGG [Enterococcus sp. LJL98]